MPSRCRRRWRYVKAMQTLQGDNGWIRWTVLPGPDSEDINWKFSFTYAELWLAGNKRVKSLLELHGCYRLKKYNSTNKMTKNVVVVKLNQHSHYRSAHEATVAAQYSEQEGLIVRKSARTRVGLGLAVGSDFRTIEPLDCRHTIIATRLLTRNFRASTVRCVVSVVQAQVFLSWMIQWINQWMSHGCMSDLLSRDRNRWIWLDEL